MYKMSYKKLEERYERMIKLNSYGDFICWCWYEGCKRKYDWERVKEYIEMVNGREDKDEFIDEVVCIVNIDLLVEDMKKFMVLME